MAKLLPILFVTLAAIGCASTSKHDIASRLDTDTGVTYVTLERALGFAASQPQLSSTARDYVYVGPVEINRMGAREHFLWIGVASTIDRNLAGVALAQTDAISFVLDGEPMVLSLGDWPATGRSATPYRPPTPVVESLGVAVSADQIGLIANAKTIEVRLHLVNDRTRRFKPWGGTLQSWQVFLTNTGFSSNMARTGRDRR